MHRAHADYVVNTPLFAGGAHDNARPEVRTSALKGALRFWWRALAFARFGNDMAALREAEAALFGSTSATAAIRLSVSRREHMKIASGSKSVSRQYVHPKLETTAMTGARYLGYGVIEGVRRHDHFRGQLYRSAIDDERASFRLNLLSRGPIPDEVLDALELLGLLGGFGARARRGYGSITLSALALDGQLVREPACSDDALAQRLRSLLASTGARPELPDFSALSAHSRVELLATGDNPLALLSAVGDRFLRYRSWGFGRNGNAHQIETNEGQIPPEQRFKDDHDWSKGTPASVGFHPRRAVLGLPHNYSVAGQGTKEVKPERHTRRASPLLLHIHRFADAQFAALATVLPARFLPAGEKIQAHRHPVTSAPDWTIFEDFFSAELKSGRAAGQAYFPQRRTLIEPSAHA